MKLPERVLLCIQLLEDSGFSAYCVGGCVRDAQMGRVPHDYDLCTNAKPQQICEVFNQYPLVRNGEKHGTIGVVLEGEMLEITTYRTEGGYTDSRHPDWVAFVDSITEDLARRDFTINAMAYHPSQGYIDPFGGRQDLEKGLLRAVGDPQTRFREDALRILRGVRFAARFHFAIDENTLDAMISCAPLMASLARERVLSELLGILPHIDAQSLLRFAPVLTVVIPELAPCIDFQQNNPHHVYDVYRHIAHTVEALCGDETLRMAALLHDIGKPETYTLDSQGIGHFYGHEKRSAEMANAILLRLRTPTLFREQVVLLIENHMILLLPDKKFLRRRCLKFGIETVMQMAALQRADMIATGTRSTEELSSYDVVQQLLEDIRKECSCLQLSDLAVNGADLIALGIAPGPEIGKILNRLLEQVVEETLPNNKAALLAAVQIPGGSK